MRRFIFTLLVSAVSFGGIVYFGNPAPRFGNTSLERAEVAPCCRVSG